MVDIHEARQIVEKALEDAAIDFEQTKEMDAYEFFGKEDPRHMKAFLFNLSRQLTERAYCYISWGIGTDRSWVFRLVRDF